MGTLTVLEPASVPERPKPAQNEGQQGPDTQNKTNTRLTSTQTWPYFGWLNNSKIF